MAGADYRIKWDSKELSRHIQYSPEIGAELMRIGQEYAELNSGQLLSSEKFGYKDSKPFVAEHRTLDNTQAVVIRPRLRGYAAYARKHNLPHW